MLRRFYLSMDISMDTTHTCTHTHTHTIQHTHSASFMYIVIIIRSSFMSVVCISSFSPTRLEEQDLEEETEEISNS